MTSQKQITRIQFPERRKFDVNNAADLEVFRKFLENNTWSIVGTCPFEVEYPFESIPDMIKDKISRKFLGI